MGKYGGRGFVVLAINIETRYDAAVAPFIRNSGYDFVPLRGTREWASRAYRVGGTPANVLIDRRGRVMFRPRVHDANDERTVELEIEALLEADGQNMKSRAVNLVCEGPWC